MVFIIGDIKGNHLFLFSLFIFHQRKDKATIFHSAFCLKYFLSTINQRLVFYLSAGGHRENNLLPHRVIIDIERACLHQNAQHIKHTSFAFVTRPHRITPPTHPALIGNTFIIFIAEPYFVHRITVAFLRPFTEIKRLQPIGRDASQRITHLEKEIDHTICGSHQISAETRLTLISHCLHIHSGNTGIFPDEFPVELKVISQQFARLYGFILCSTLRSRGTYSEPRTQ